MCVLQATARLRGKNKGDTAPPACVRYEQTTSYIRSTIIAAMLVRAVLSDSCEERLLSISGCRTPRVFAWNRNSVREAIGSNEHESYGSNLALYLDGFVCVSVLRAVASCWI